MYIFKNALTLELKAEEGILEKYAKTKQRNMDPHNRKDAAEFEKEVFEFIGMEIEEIIEEDDDERIIELNGFLSVKFEIKNKYSDVYEIDLKVHEYEIDAIFGDLY